MFFVPVIVVIFSKIEKYIESKDNFRRILLTVAFATAIIMMARGSVYNSFFTIFISIFIVNTLYHSIKLKIT